MDQISDIHGLLALMDRPAFCVSDGRIVAANAGAETYMLSPDQEISELLETGAAEYAEFTSGCLFLTLNIAGNRIGACVTRMREWDLFRLEETSDTPELQALALASRELRKYLHNLMSIPQKLLPLAEDNADAQKQLAHWNQGLYQLLRVAENMSDANRFSAGSARPELLDLTAVFRETFEKAASLMADAGFALEYQDLPQPVYGLGDRERLEKALFQMLSNAMKFTPKGGSICGKLTHRGDQLYLSVQDSGSGISGDLRGSLFSRYTRQPGLEDGRYGIGLGMVLIRAAAAAHGGTVLVDQPESGGTRVIFSMAVKTGPDRPGALRQRVDFSGGWDAGLVALSESLPPEVYMPRKP